MSDSADSGSSASGDLALIIVDVQNDFCAGGALEVPDAARIFVPLNAALAAALSRDLLVIATRDWHPDDHSSFATQGGPWPVHCVQGSPGAGFVAAVPALTAAPGGAERVQVVSKGTERCGDGYSAFEAAAPGDGLLERLQARGVTRVAVAGLATDYCVRATVLDACAGGLDVVVLEDAIAGVEAAAGDVARAEQAMRDAGARFVSVDSWIREWSRER